MSNEEMLQAGIAAAKSGDLARASALFAEVVRSDPSSEQGWFLLGMSLAAPDRREYCLRRVLALNPDHHEARRQLERLTGSVSVSPAQVQRSAAGVQQSAISDRQSAVSDAKAPSPLRSDAQPPVPPRKKPNSILVAALGFVGTLIVGGLLVGYLLFSGRLAEWMAPSFAAIPTPFSLTRSPETSHSAATLTRSPETSHSATALPSPRPTVSYTPSFENAQCPFDAPGGADVSCGYLIVPEDRTGDPSHTIRLATAVYHATGASRLPEPVIFLQGGPGGEAVKLSANAYEILVAPFLKERDFIAFDQRGTGVSEPALKCDELTKAYLQDIHGQIPASARKLVYSNAFLSCQGLMTTQGVHLNAYTTAASAADVRDLLGVLGYQKADLYGASYGTRLAQVIMRDYPEIVRSVILDSVVPTETNFFSHYPDAIGSALKRLFESCAADAQCNSAYPELETVFWALVSQLDARPVSLTVANPQTGSITENVDGSAFIDIVLGSLKQSNLISTAPQTIYRFKAGDYSTMIAAEYSLPFAFEGISAGLYISMMCHEHILATTAEELQSVASTPQDIREYAWLPFYGSAQDIFKSCQRWGAAGPGLGENDPVSSELPTLIITGTFDPSTPPMYARQVADRLSHGYYFEFPNQGHTPTAADSSGCAMETVLSFLDNPAVEPDRSCLDAMEKPHFLLPYTGTPEIRLKTEDVAGVSVKVPADWPSLGDGFYFRGNSPFDITQIGILQAPVSSAGLVKWLSMKAYGYRGLDAAPVEADQRQAHGLEWQLYTDTSYGRPVDLAMADYPEGAQGVGGGSFVVISFSNIDEHEAIYRTVFLPMVDSVQP